MKFLMISLLLSGCAALHSQNCTETAGYEKGFNDAKMGRLKLLSQFSMMCSGKDIEIAQNAYLKGYDEGSKNSTPTVNLTFKGGKVGVAAAYKCQIYYNGQTFSKESVTEPDARNAVLTECDKKFKGCFTRESNVTCSKN